MCGDDDYDYDDDHSFILRSLMEKLMGMSICKDFPFLLLNGHLAFSNGSAVAASIAGA